MCRRREFLALAAAVRVAERLRPIVISLNVMFDQGSHSAKGLGEAEISKFRNLQEKARREFATSGILFEIHFTEGAYSRTQGYSEIPTKFLAPRAINLFITDSLGYDIDRDRTGGCSMGPRPRSGKYPADPFYKTFLGLQEARDTTLSHEYAHHFTLDTRRNPTAAKNLWADLRNDYWLWRQRHGASIPEFRACAGVEWARYESAGWTGGRGVG